MKDIQQLKDEFDKLGESDNLAMIKFYESNIDSINNINPKLDNNHYDFKMRLQSEYGLSLVSAGYYSQAVSVLKNSIKLFENAPTVESEKIHEITFYQHLLWNYGLALWETKKINEAQTLFERLVLNYPKNEKYRVWLNGLKAEKIKKITRPLWVICSIWLICELTIFEKFDQNLQLLLSLIGILFLGSVGIIELRIYFLRKN